MVVQTSTAMAENNEDYLDALNDFQRKQGKEIPEELEKLLCQIAQTGEPLFSWNKLKPLVICKLENVIQDYVETNPDETMEILPNVENVEFKDMRDRLLQAINAFTNAPFTIQRLCELLTEPRRYYQRSDKFMRGIEKNVQVVSTVTSGGKRIYTSVSHMQTSASSAMVNGIMTDSNGHHDDEDKFDNIATVNKEEHHPTIPAHSAASSDIEAMDTDPSEGNKGVEQTDKKDVSKLPVSGDDIAADSKTEDGAKSESRTENIVSDSSETLDSSVKHESIVTDNERTSETKDESVTSSTDAEGVHLGEQRPPVENKTESPVSEEADGSSSIQDVSKPPPGNHAPEDTNSSGSDSVLSQSETTSVKSNSEDNAVEESSQSQDTSNGTISDAENTSHSDDNSDKDSSAPPKTCIDEQTVGAQQESAESSAPSEQKEPTSEPGEVNQKQETQAVSSETSLEQTIAEKVDSSQGEDDAEESSDTQKTTSVTESGDAQLTTATSENSAKQTSEADSESSTQSSDGKVKETDEMEVNSVSSSSSSSSQPQQQAKDDQSAKEEESQNTSEVQNVVPTVDEQSSKETENASSTEEAMDQN